MFFSLSLNDSECVSKGFLLVRKENPSVFLFCEMVGNGILSIFVFRGRVRNEITKFREFSPLQNVGQVIQNRKLTPKIMFILVLPRKLRAECVSYLYFRNYLPRVILYVYSESTRAQEGIFFTF